MSALLKDYPLKATEDCRSAIAFALAQELSKLKATAPKSAGGREELRFKVVHDTWASFESRAVSADGELPAAAVLPDRPVYTPATLTPRALEDTWSGGDPDELLDDGVTKRYPIGDGSGDGFVLYEAAELEVPIVVTIRTWTKAQRKAFVKRIEEHFIEDGALLPDPSTLPEDSVPEAIHHPIRYGRVVVLSTYYNRTARFTLQAHQLLDTAASAMENRWFAQFEFLAHAQVCVLRRARAMSPRIQFVANGAIDQRG